MNYCACGCGEKVNRNYVAGHYWKGKKRSIADIEKMSKSHKGKPSPKKGIKMSDAQKKKLSINLKGRKLSQETIAKIIATKKRIML